MNIYEKLMAARLEFHQSPIKKSGYNSFAKYDYFELADFVLPILKLFEKYKLFSHVSFDKEMATLTIIDIEKPDSVVCFTSPMGKAELKGTHEIQQIGAVETYQRRYLYVLAMDIVEHDAIDSGPGVSIYDQLDNAKTLQELQDAFAAAYQNSSGKERDDVKAHYNMCKAKFVQKAD